MPDKNPAAVAALMQIMAEADKKYDATVASLREITEDPDMDMYDALAVMGFALNNASKEQLISIVLTGLKREAYDTL